MADDSIVELRIWGVPRLLPALGRVASGARGLRGLPGLTFSKVLGTGSGRTFTLHDADAHHWAVLTVWQDAAAAERGATSPYLRRWDGAATEKLTVRMRPLSARGRWSRREPFGTSHSRSSVDDWSGPVAAVTRARLRPTRMFSFWRAVPPVVEGLTASDGLRLAVGIGESPIGLQGTFSLWDDADSLRTFAYRAPQHVDAIRRTRPERWYAEELFARFAVTWINGTYEGVPR